MLGFSYEETTCSFDAAVLQYSRIVQIKNKAPPNQEQCEACDFGFGDDAWVLLTPAYIENRIAVRVPSYVNRAQPETLEPSEGDVVYP